MDRGCCFHTLGPLCVLQITIRCRLLLWLRPKQIGQRFGSSYVTGNAEALCLIIKLFWRCDNTIFKFQILGCMDWIYATWNVSLAYTFELADHWQIAYGFILPADQIIDACLETTDGIVAMVAEIRRQELF